jgi:hypothetical protein
MQTNIMFVVLGVAILIIVVAGLGACYGRRRVMMSQLKRSIPDVFYMCHKELKHIATYSKNWIRLNPHYTMKLYDNALCEDFLLQEFGQKHYDVFKYISAGPIKADFWRVCVLYKYGGIYVDSDIEPLLPLKDYIEHNVDFVTCILWRNHYNPHFIMAHAGDVHLKLCIDTYVRYYDNMKPFTYDGWSIVGMFDRIFRKHNLTDEGVYHVDRKKMQLLKNVRNDATAAMDPHEHSTYKNQKVFNNRYPTYNHANHDFTSASPPSKTI